MGGAVLAVVIATVLELIASELLFSTLVREYELFVRMPTLLTFLAIIVLAPVIEEFAKVMVVKNFSRYIWRPRNGLIFGAACGLGFAATENFLYEVTMLIDQGIVAVLGLALVRSVSSSLMHAAATSVSGYGVARAKSYGLHWWPYYVIAVLMHAAFNTFASVGELFSGDLAANASVYGLVFSVALVVVAFLILRVEDQRLSRLRVGPVRVTYELVGAVGGDGRLPARHHDLLVLAAVRHRVTGGEHAMTGGMHVGYRP